MKKEIKTFFDKDNCLNKGYLSDLSRPSNNNYLKKKFENILPPLEVANEYENLYPGTMAKIINLAEKEQLHRYQQDNEISESSKNKLKFLNNLIVGGVIAILAIALILTNWLSNSIYSIIITDTIIFIMLSFFIIYHKNFNKLLPFSSNNIQKMNTNTKGKLPKQFKKVVSFKK